MTINETLLIIILSSVKWNKKSTMCLCKQLNTCNKPNLLGGYAHEVIIGHA
jgi:hypothetical protein